MGDESDLIMSHIDLDYYDNARARHYDESLVEVGKYVVVCDSRYNLGAVIYYTERNGRPCWTTKKKLARLLTRGSAEKVKAKLKYNNPRVIKV